jgi:hypothetical protein
MAPPDLFSVLRKWLPYTVAGQRRANDTDPALSALLKHPGLQSIALDENVQPVLGAARMLSGDSLLPDDHMVRCHCVHLCVRVGPHAPTQSCAIAVWSAAVP